MLARVTRLAIRRAVANDSRRWLALAIATGGLRLFRKLTSHEPKVVYSEELKPGQTLTITHSTTDPNRTR